MTEYIHLLTSETTTDIVTAYNWRSLVTNQYGDISWIAQLDEHTYIAFGEVVRV